MDMLCTLLYPAFSRYVTISSYPNARFVYHYNRYPQITITRLWLLAYLAIVAEGVGAYAIEIPGMVTECLENNSAAMRQLTIEYTQERSSNISKKLLLKQIKQPEWRSIFNKNYYRLHLQDGQWHFYTKTAMTGENSGKLFYNENILIFDGEITYNIGPETVGGIHSSIGILDKKYHQHHMSVRFLFGYNAFISHAGFVVPEESVSTWEPLESAILYKLRKGAEIIDIREGVDGSDENVSVEMKDGGIRYRYVLDISKNCVMRTCEEYTPKGDLKYAITNSEFTQLKNSEAWLPKHSRKTYYTYHSVPSTPSKDPLFFADIIITQINNDWMSQETFAFDWKRPGNVIGDSRIPGAVDTDTGTVTYRIPADLDYLDDVIESARHGKDFVFPMDDQPNRNWLIAINVVVIVALLGIYWVRRRGIAG